MQLEELVNQYYDDLNENDLMIWKYILAHKKECCEISIDELSKRCNVFTRRFGACQRFAVRKTKVYRFIGKSALSAIPYKPNRLSQGVGSKKQLTQSSSCKRCKVGYDAFRME